MTMNGRWAVQSRASYDITIRACDQRFLWTCAGQDHRMGCDCERPLQEDRGQFVLLYVAAHMWYQLSCSSSG